MEILFTKKSFTLIEILVVIVVIGVLSAFILVGMSSITSSANIAKGKAFINSLDNSLLLARVSQWKFDEASGTVANDSWLTNIGTIYIDSSLAGYGDTHTSGWMSSSSCVSGTCLKLDGSNDYIFIPSSTSLEALWENKKISIGLWLKLNSSSGDWFMVQRGSHIQLMRFNNSFAFTLKFSDSVWRGLTTGWTPINNKWYYVLASWDGSIFKGYVDTVVLGTYTYSGDLIAAGRNSGGSLGSVSDGSFMNINGIIDDVRIYNQAISISQVQQSYYVGLNKLFRSSEISFNEFNQRLVELKYNLANNE